MPHSAVQTNTITCTQHNAVVMVTMTTHATDLRDESNGSFNVLGPRELPLNQPIHLRELERGEGGMEGLRERMWSAKG